MIVFKNFTVDKMYDNLNYHIKKNEINVLLGDNGSGKSTLIYYLYKIYGNYDGQILFNNNDLCNVDINNKIVSVYQNPYVQFIGFDVIDELTYFYEQNQNIVDMSLDILNKLPFDNKPLNQLSGGQAQILNILKSIYMKPDLLIIDEAFSNIDKRTKEYLFNLIKQSNITVLLITNNLEDVIYGDNVSKLMDKQISEYNVNDNSQNLLDNQNDIIINYNSHNFKYGYNLLTGDSGSGKTYLLDQMFKDKKLNTRYVTQYPFLQIYFVNFIEFLNLHHINVLDICTHLDMLNIENEILSKDATTLSTGELTILFLLCYYHLDTDIYLIDESLEVLDLNKQKYILKLFKDKNVIFITHNLSIYNNQKVNVVEVCRV